MKTIQISLSKTHVFEEVARLSAYVGSKMLDAKDGSFERIAVTDADRDLLERYWQEACAQLTTLLRPFIDTLREQPYIHGTNLRSDYRATLTVSDRYDDTLTDSITASLTLFLVHTILSKWFVLTNKEEAAGYVAGAQANLEDAKTKLYHKLPPTL